MRRGHEFDREKGAIGRVRRRKEEKDVIIL